MKTLQRQNYDSQKGLLTSLLKDEAALTHDWYLKMAEYLPWGPGEKDRVMREFESLQQKIKSQSAVVESLKGWANA